MALVSRIATVLLCYDDVLFLESTEDKPIKNFLEIPTLFKQIRYPSKIGKLASATILNSHINASCFLSFGISA